MKTLAIAVGVIAVIILILIVSLVGSYNRLVNLSQGVDSQWAQVQNVYQRRADLIPNLVNTVQGAANFEKSTLTQITEARASVGKVNVSPNTAPTDPQQLAEFEKSQAALGGALSRLLVVAENYPQLKSNQNFLGLQTQLEGTENRISVERGRFNDTVQQYNTRVKSFPTVLIAGMFGFSPKPYFSAAPTAATPPTVNFNFNSQPTTAPATK